MNRILSITSALVAAALFAATAVAATAAAGTAPAGTAPAGAGASGKQAGYVAVPTTFHSASVRVHVPTVHCTMASPDSTVQLGLFVSERKAGVVRPVSLAVEATCKAGAASYRVVYRNQFTGGALHVHRVDVVALALTGVKSFSIDDRTSGQGEGGGAAGPGATNPKALRPVFIGVRWIGPRPTGLHARFTTALVDHTKLSKLRHHRRGNTGLDRVGTLHGGRFQVTFGMPVAA